MISGKPVLIEGGLSVDDRGSVSFANDCDLSPFRRFYLVSNHQANQVRAWHAHQREAKAVMVISGAAIVAAVRVDDWFCPSTLPSLTKIHRHVLSASKPAALLIPPGYANGFKTLTEGARLLWFSTATVEESKADDYRWAWNYWNPWGVGNR